MQVKFLDLAAQYKHLEKDIDRAVKGVLESGVYILGENVSFFESEAAEYCGVDYCAGTASGTDAIVLALMAAGVPARSGVITTPFTFTASIEAIVRAGAEPVLCDIEPDTFNIDVMKIEGYVNKNTSAVLPVHLYGHPADMDAISDIARRRGLKVIEDAAQSFGALYKGKKTGAMGDVGCFSFFPSKTLGAAGDAGMAATCSREIYENLKLLRAHGLRRGECVNSGLNSRLDEIQAAILRVKLRHVDDWLAGRKKAAGYYSEELADSGVSVPEVKEYAVHSFNYYVIKCPDRDELRSSLFSRGIETGVYYPSPAHLHGAFRRLGYGKGDFPAAEELAGRTLALPIYPEITRAQQEYTADMIKKFYGG